jgi:hypothetical protein
VAERDVERGGVGGSASERECQDEETALHGPPSWARSRGAAEI